MLILPFGSKVIAEECWKLIYERLEVRWEKGESITQILNLNIKGDKRILNHGVTQ